MLEEAIHFPNTMEKFEINATSPTSTATTTGGCGDHRSPRYPMNGSATPEECRRAYSEILDEEELEDEEMEQASLVGAYEGTDCLDSPMLDMGAQYPTSNSADGDKKTRKFICRYCHKAFGLMNVLKVHERIHTGEKPYVCEICHKAFNQSGSLNRHRNTHKKRCNDNRSYPCRFCSCEFLHSSHLQEHENATHFGELVQLQQQNAHQPSGDTNHPSPADAPNIKREDSPAGLPLAPLGLQGLPPNYSPLNGDFRLSGAPTLAPLGRPIDQFSSMLTVNSQPTLLTQSRASPLPSLINPHAPMLLRCDLCTKQFENRTDFESHLRQHYLQYAGVIPFQTKILDFPPFPDTSLTPTSKAALDLINRDFNFKYSKHSQNPDVFLPTTLTPQSLPLPNPAFLAAAMLASNPSRGAPPPPPPNPLAVSHVLNALVGMAGLNEGTKQNADPFLNAMMKLTSVNSPNDQYSGGNFNPNKPDINMSILNMLSGEKNGGPRLPFPPNNTMSAGITGSPNGSSSTKSCCVSPKSGNSEGLKQRDVGFGPPPPTPHMQVGGEIIEPNLTGRRRLSPSSSSSLDGKQCIYCDKRFTCSSALRIHFRKHSGERPYKCRFCSKAFSQNGTLKRHYQTCKLAVTRKPDRLDMEPASVDTSASSPKMLKTDPLYPHHNQDELVDMMKNELPLLSPNRLDIKLPGKFDGDDLSNCVLEQHLEGALRKLLFDNASFRGGGGGGGAPVVSPLSNVEAALFRPDGERKCNVPETADGQTDDAPEDLSSSRIYETTKDASNEKFNSFENNERQNIDLSNSTYQPETHDRRSPFKPNFLTNEFCPSKSEAFSKIKKHNNPERLLNLMIQLGDLYRCDYCNIYFRDASLHSIHISLHGSCEPFACSICGLCLSDPSSFALHFTRNHHHNISMTSEDTPIKYTCQEKSSQNHSPVKSPIEAYYAVKAIVANNLQEVDNCSSCPTNNVDL